MVLKYRPGHHLFRTHPDMRYLGIFTLAAVSLASGRVVRRQTCLLTLASRIFCRLCPANRVSEDPGERITVALDDLEMPISGTRS